MGMSTSVVFLRSKDNDQYQKMLRVAQTCTEAGVELPEEVDNYFDGEFEYNPEGPLEMNAEKVATEYHAEMQEGYEIKVSDIPDGVDVIRFYNSY
jgi:antitoxin component HigA of HigAB toxin-antitoxin module